jgi:hypothetical protein
MAIECKKCPYIVSVAPGERAPPWCPRCGADLKAATPALVGAAVVESAGFADGSSAAPGRRPVDDNSPEPAARLTPSLPGEEPLGPSDTPEEIFTGKLLWQVLAVGCALVCFGIVAVAVSQLIQPKKPPQMGMYGCLGLFAIGGLVMVYVAYRLFGQKYAVYSDRLVEWQCFKPTSFRWDQIREVFQLAHPAWTKYRVVTRTGRTFTLSGEINDHKRLGEWIAGRVAAQLLPAAWSELEAGRDVGFGPLRVNRAGVVVDGQLEPWHRIGVLALGLNPNPKKGTSLVSNMLHLRLGSSWVELGDIPNYRLFAQLAHRLFPVCIA